MRSTALVLLPAALALAACVEGGGGTLGPGGQTASAGQVCAGKAARLLKTPRESVSIVQVLPYPEGEVVTLAITGKGKVRCVVDVDGKAGTLVWVEGGPQAPATAGAPAAG